MNDRRRDERGQVIVIVAIAMVVIMIGTAFVVDAGFAWAETRNTQNAADAAARAGAVTLANKAAGNPVPAGGWDEAVRNAVYGSAGINRTAVERAEYTDWQGTHRSIWISRPMWPSTACGCIGLAQRGQFTGRLYGIGVSQFAYSAAASS